MWKLYLKKLWDTVEFAAAFAYTLVLYGLAFNLFVMPFLPLQRIVSKESILIVLSILSLAIVLAYVKRRRRNNKSRRRMYTKKLTFPLPTFGKDFWQTLKSRESLAHTLAFLTLDTPFTLYISISGFSTIWKFFLELMLLLLIQTAAFILINTYLWCLAHRRWIAYWQNHAG